MGSFLSGFFIGGFCGIYLAQNYEIPAVKNLLSNIMSKIKEMEKPKPS